MEFSRPQASLHDELAYGWTRGGPAATVVHVVPDRHHFRGSFGGKDVIPLYRDADAVQPNVTAGLLEILSEVYGENIGSEDLFAYAYAVLASPSYTGRFWDELTIPGPRLPLTKNLPLFRHGAELGKNSNTAAHLRRTLRGRR